MKFKKSYAKNYNKKFFFFGKLNLQPFSKKSVFRRHFYLNLSFSILLHRWIVIREIQSQWVQQKAQSLIRTDLWQGFLFDFLYIFLNRSFMFRMGAGWMDSAKVWGQPINQWNEKFHVQKIQKLWACFFCFWQDRYFEMTRVKISN